MLMKTSRRSYHTQTKRIKTRQNILNQDNLKKRKDTTHDTTTAKVIRKYNARQAKENTPSRQGKLPTRQDNDKTRQRQDETTARQDNY
jgi:hypothetical protein